MIKKEFAISTRKGSHVTLRHDHTPVTIPAGNNKLKIELLLGVLSKTGISKEEFVNDFNSGLVK